MEASPTLDFSPAFVLGLCGLAASVTALILFLAKRRGKPLVVVVLLLLVAVFAVLALGPIVDLIAASS